MGERVRKLWAQFGIGVMVVLLSSLATLAGLGWRAQPGVVVAVAAPRAAVLLTDFYAPETASDGVHSRWTAGTAAITIPNSAWQQLPQVRLTIADSARPVTTTIQVGQMQVRRGRGAPGRKRSPMRTTACKTRVRARRRFSARAARRRRCAMRTSQVWHTSSAIVCLPPHTFAVWRPTYETSLLAEHCK